MISSPGCVCFGEGHAQVNVDPHLDDLASGSAEIVPLQVGSLDPRHRRLLLSPRRMLRQNACNDQAAIAITRVVFTKVLLMSSSCGLGFSPNCVDRAPAQSARETRPHKTAAHDGSSLPACFGRCSRRAFQSGQLASCPPVQLDVSPCVLPRAAARPQARPTT